MAQLFTTLLVIDYFNDHNPQLAQSLRAAFAAGRFNEIKMLVLPQPLRTPGLGVLEAMAPSQHERIDLLRQSVSAGNYGLPASVVPYSRHYASNEEYVAAQLIELRFTERHEDQEQCIARSAFLAYHFERPVVIKGYEFKLLDI